MRVGLFDSGLGGLTVLKTLLKKYPHNEYIYYGDTKNVPYGNKKLEELNLLSSMDVEFLLSKNVDLIIIACGTVSSNCLEYLRKKYKIPIIDILSPTINYLNDSNYQNIGIIATHNTISSHVFKDNVGKNVIEIETPKFVDLIENDRLDEIPMAIHEYLGNFKKMDALVLGCTHYPIIRKYLEDYLSNVDLIDMSENLIISNSSDCQKLEIYFSSLNDTIISNAKKILNDFDIEILGR